MTLTKDSVMYIAASFQREIPDQSDVGELI